MSFVILIAGGVLVFTSCKKDTAVTDAPKDISMQSLKKADSNPAARNAGKSDGNSATISLSEDMFTALKQGGIIASVLDGGSFRAIAVVGNSYGDVQWTNPAYTDWCRIPTLRMQAYISAHWAEWKAIANSFGYTIVRMVTDPDCPNSNVTVLIPSDHPGYCEICQQSYTGTVTAELIMVE